MSMAQRVVYDAATKFVLLQRYDDARALLAGPGWWRDADQAEEGSLIHAFKPGDLHRPGDRNAGMSWLDEPDHMRVRGPIQVALSRRVAAFRPQLERLVDAQLDALAGRTSFDALKDFAAPIPVAAIGALLGVEADDQAQFRSWSNAAFGVFSPNTTADEQRAARTASEAISAYFEAVMAARRIEERDDLVSDLVLAQAGGAPISDAEIRVNLMALLVGGNVSTADLITNALWLLLNHPAELAKLRSDASLITGAVEETLRLEPPTSGALRVAATEHVIGGCPIHARQVVGAMIPAANRDPEVFAEPDRFDISRKGPTHVSFGGGAHFCIGAPLARLGAQVAIAAILSRYPKLRLAEPGAAPAWRPTPFFHGLTTLALCV